MSQGHGLISSPGCPVNTVLQRACIPAPHHGRRGVPVISPAEKCFFPVSKDNNVYDPLSIDSLLLFCKNNRKGVPLEYGTPAMPDLSHPHLCIQKNIYLISQVFLWFPRGLHGTKSCKSMQALYILFDPNTLIFSPPVSLTEMFPIVSCCIFFPDKTALMSVTLWLWWIFRFGPSCCPVIFALESSEKHWTCYLSNFFFHFKFHFKKPCISQFCKYLAESKKSKVF